jgi:hypothetical protein
MCRSNMFPLALPFPLPPPVGDEVALKQPIKVSSGPDKPENAFTTVKYEDHWFWINKGDFQSKRTFAFLMILFSLTETGGKEGLPLRLHSGM